MIAVPTVKPLTTPVALTVATEISLLLHTPKEEELLSAVVPPRQTLSTPVIGVDTGTTLTVSGVVAIPVHPKPSVIA